MPRGHTRPSPSTSPSSSLLPVSLSSVQPESSGYFSLQYKWAPCNINAVPKCPLESVTEVVMCHQMSVQHSQWHFLSAVEKHVFSVLFYFFLQSSLLHIPSFPSPNINLLFKSYFLTNPHVEGISERRTSRTETLYIIEHHTYTQPHTQSYTQFTVTKVTMDPYNASISIT